MKRWLILMLLVLPAHSSTGVDDWVSNWEVRAENGLTEDLVSEFVEFRARHPQHFASTYAPPVVRPTPQAARYTSPPGVDQWRGLVALHFPEENVEAALRVMWCESRGVANAVGPTQDYGLFQHRIMFWEDRSTKAGFGGADILDPNANIGVAAWLSNGGSDWGHWVCQP